MERFFTTGEVSRMLGIAHYKITYMIEVGAISKPIEISKRRMFSSENITQIKNYLERRKKVCGLS